MSSTPEIEAIRHALARPFDPAEVKFKPQTVSGNRALAIPYVDARTIMERLDDVFGVGGWQTSYREAKDGVICTLSVQVGGVVYARGHRRGERAARRGRPPEGGVLRRLEAGGRRRGDSAIPLPAEARRGRTTTRRSGSSSGCQRCRVRRPRPRPGRRRSG